MISLLSFVTIKWYDVKTKGSHNDWEWHCFRTYYKRQRKMSPLWIKLLLYMSWYFELNSWNIIKDGNAIFWYCLVSGKELEMCVWPNVLCNSTKQCIQREQVCDSNHDCPDGSDEDKKLCSMFIYFNVIISFCYIFV